MCICMSVYTLLLYLFALLILCFWVVLQQIMVLGFWVTVLERPGADASEQAPAARSAKWHI